MAIEEIRNYVALSGGLATGGQPSEEQIQELAQAGFELIINLGLLDPRYCLEDEVGLVRSLGMEYHHIPVNFQAPTIEDLTQFFTVMQAAAGKRIFVHCAANYRVSSFVSLYPGEARLVKRASGGARPAALGTKRGMGSIHRECPASARGEQLIKGLSRIDMAPWVMHAAAMQEATGMNGKHRTDIKRGLRVDITQKHDRWRENSPAAS